MNTSLKIVAADDEPEMRDFLEKALTRIGHQVLAVAENGKELVEYCCQLQPDLIITDVKMPVMDGIEATTEICKERLTPSILITAYHDPELIERAELDHIMAYLVKPVGLADLQPAIAIAMRRFGEFQTLRQECQELRQSLADRKVIEQAKGLLMKLTGVDEKEAFRRLQELAADKNQKLIDAAQSLLAVQKAFGPK